MAEQKIKWYNSLNLKLIFILGLANALVMGMFAYILITTHRKHLSDEIIRGAIQLSETVKRSTYYDMLMDQRENVYRIMETIGAQEGIEKVRIFNKDGKIMFSTSKDEVGELLDTKAEACYVCHSLEKPLERIETSKKARIFTTKDGYRVLGVITPIYNEESCYNAACHYHPKEQTVLGIIDINMSLAEIDKEMKQTKKFMVLFTILSVIGISFLVSFFIHRYVHRPIKKLVKATRMISNGNLDYHIELNTRDEIGYLANNFDIMTKNLKKAKEEIDNFVKTLEEKVEERTRELKEAQTQLIHSEKLASIGRLSAGIAHEINNPLGAILIYSYLLKEDLKESPYRGNIEKIIKETEKVKNIVNGLLEFARPREPQFKPVDVNSIVEKTLDMLSRQVLFHNIVIKKSIWNSPLIVRADESQIQQVFTNIIINAAEAMNGKGELTIKTRLSDGKYAEIEFTDTGCGIPPERMSRIFEPFFTTKTDRGVGLGLSISQSIITRHNGFISVQSEVNKGTTFIVRLPITSGSQEMKDG